MPTGAPETPTVRFCTRCEEYKLITEFTRQDKGKGGLRSICRFCSQDEKFKHRYDISRKNYLELCTKQDGKCAICGLAPNNVGRNYSLHVDHDHKTGQVRGLVCINCNRGLGAFSDSPEILQRAIDYLLHIKAKFSLVRSA
jgi:hypothetical protein